MGTIGEAAEFVKHTQMNYGAIPTIIQSNATTFLNRCDSMAKDNALNKSIKRFEEASRVLLVASSSAHEACIIGSRALEQYIPKSIETIVTSGFNDRRPFLRRSDLVLVVGSKFDAEVQTACQHAEASGASLAVLDCPMSDETVDGSLCGARGALAWSDVAPGATVMAMPKTGLVLECEECVCGECHQYEHVARSREHPHVFFTVLCLLLAMKASMDERLGQDAAPVRAEVREVGALLGRALASVDKCLEDSAWMIKRIMDRRHVLFLGRGIQAQVCNEAARCMQVFGRLHGEGVYSGELKHGTLALFDESLPVVVIATHGQHHDKIMMCIHEVMSRATVPLILTHCDCAEWQGGAQQHLMCVERAGTPWGQAMVNGMCLYEWCRQVTCAAFDMQSEAR